MTDHVMHDLTKKIKAALVVNIMIMYLTYQANSLQVHYCQKFINFILLDLLLMPVSYP